MHDDPPSPYMSLIVGVILIIGGMYAILTDSGGSYWGVPVVDWVGWLFLPMGIVICILAARSLRRDKEKSDPCAGDDAALSIPPLSDDARPEYTQPRSLPGTAAHSPNRQKE